MLLRKTFFTAPLALIPFAGAVHAQQVADTEFRPPIAKRAFAEGKGPVVLVDEAHYNFHTASGRYLAFADLLRRDGYVIEASTERFSPESLKSGKILVIANALHESNEEEWSPPNPSAFTDGLSGLLYHASHRPRCARESAVRTAHRIMRESRPERAGSRIPGSLWQQVGPRPAQSVTAKADATHTDWVRSPAIGSPHQAYLALESGSPASRGTRRFQCGTTLTGSASTPRNTRPAR